MGSWRKSLGVLAGGLVSLGGFLPSAHGQFSPPPGGMMGAPPGMMPGMMGSPPPGAFSGNPLAGGVPAEFPNPAQRSPEPVSPFTIPNDGIPGAFTEQLDPRPRRPAPYTMVLRAEYVGWWISKSGSNVDLATTTTNFPNEIGALGQQNTQIIFPAGGGSIDYRMLTGFRAAMGIAIGYVPPIEVSGFSFNRNLGVFQAGSSDATGIFLARPVQINNIPNGPNAGLETTELVNIPGVLNGTMTVMSRMSFWSVDVNAFLNVIDTDRFKIDFLAGYRHVDLYESLEITNTSGGFAGQVVFGGAVQPVGFTATVFDMFRTRNAFDGGQIGLRSVFSVDRLSVFTDVKVAMGNTRHVLTIDGNTTLFQPAANRVPQTLPGGLLALPGNIGTSSRNEFSFVPEANFSVSYQLGQNIRLFGGYSALYWSSVARPGDHLNSVIDSRGVPSSLAFTPGTGTAPATPPLVFRDFFAHGFNVGVEFGF